MQIDCLLSGKLELTVVWKAAKVNEASWMGLESRES